MNTFEPSPYARLLALLLAVLGTLLSKNAAVAAAAYGIGLSTLLFSKNVRHAHWIFFVFAVLPFALWNFGLWTLLIAAPPGQAHGSNPHGGFEYALLMTARLALLALTFQLCFIGLPVSRLVKLLRAWGVKGDALLIVASSLTIWPELRERVDHVVTARYARGLVPKRSIWESMKALPLVLKPVVFNSLHHSIERSEMWQHQRLLDHIVAPSREPHHFRLGDTFWIALAAAWLLTSVWIK